MIWKAVPVVGLLLLGCTPAANVVHVAPPTGNHATDRASILAALQEIQTGGTVQFAQGMYLVGEIIPVANSRITLLGHSEGTVLRGCHPNKYEAMEREAVQAFQSDESQEGFAVHSRCGMMELSGGHVTVRGLTFEYSRLGLVLGCCEGEEELPPGEGGYLVEGNTFRNTGNSIRTTLWFPEPTVIRDNTFINTFHAVSAGARNLHIIGNDISVPEPGQVPGMGHPGFAIAVSAAARGATAPAGHDANICENNLIADNRIEGHPDGIVLSAFQPGTSCRNNVIRDNTIIVRRVPYSPPWLYADLIPVMNEADPSFVGVPLALVGVGPDTAAEGSEAPSQPMRVEDNLVEGNHIIGAEGVGIDITHASRNRVINNTIAGMRPRLPFPGNTLGAAQDWDEANGAGIWVSSGSDENEVVGNSFEDIATYTIVLRGSRNIIQTRSAGATVLDLGTGNQLNGPDRR
jgi:parallel beta-helix repeat protein